MSYAMGIDSWISGKVCYNRLANSNNLHADDYTCFFYCTAVECIEFLMQRFAFREHLSYAPAKEFHDAGEHIYSDVKSSNWWWNEHVCYLSFVIATMILTASLATVATWSYECPIIRQFRPVTSYKLFGRQEGLASIFGSRRH